MFGINNYKLQLLHWYIEEEKDLLLGPERRRREKEKRVLASHLPKLVPFWKTFLET